MNPDPRIKGTDNIYTVLDTDKAIRLLMHTGYFADYLYNFRDIDKLYFSILTDVDKNAEEPYGTKIGRHYRYFLPATCVNSNLKPCEIKGDLPFKVGNVIELRRKNNQDEIIRTVVTGICLKVGYIEYICFCDFKLSAFELLNYEYSIDGGNTWNVCGVRG